MDMCFFLSFFFQIFPQVFFFPIRVFLYVFCLFFKCFSLSITLRELLNMMMVKQSKLLSESGFQRVFWVEMNIFTGFFFKENFGIPLGTSVGGRKYGPESYSTFSEVLFFITWFLGGQNL